MEKHITDERTGLKYELVGDYYLLAGEDDPEPDPIGIWGQRHCRFLREHKKGIYSGLLITGKLDAYLRDIDRQAEEMCNRLIDQMKELEGITEELKAANQMEWVRRMNGIRNRAMEVVLHELVYC